MSILPIDRLPVALPRLEELDLFKLNAALYRAQARAAEAGIMQMRSEEAQRAMESAVVQYKSLLSEISQRAGVELSKTHGWDEATGEIKPIPEGGK